MRPLLLPVSTMEHRGLAALRPVVPCQMSFHKRGLNNEVKESANQCHLCCSAPGDARLAPSPATEIARPSAERARRVFRKPTV